MALKYDITYPGKSAAPDANYPQGSARNVTVSGDGTGFPADYQWFNDWAGFFQRLLIEGGITPSGAADTVLASDYFDALDVLVSGQTLPVASTSTAGITAYATSAETITGIVTNKATTPEGVQAKAATVGEAVAGTSTTKFVTPAALNGRTALTTRTGLVELATDAETIAGTDAARAVTPAGLQAKVASVTAKGIVELATSAETIAGTDAARAVTPAGVAAAIGAVTMQRTVETVPASTASVVVNAPSGYIFWAITSEDGRARVLSIATDGSSVTLTTGSYGFDVDCDVIWKS